MKKTETKIMIVASISNQSEITKILTQHDIKYIDLGSENEIKIKAVILK